MKKIPLGIFHIRYCIKYILFSGTGLSFVINTSCLPSLSSYYTMMSHVMFYTLYYHHYHQHKYNSIITVVVKVLSIKKNKRIIMNKMTCIHLVRLVLVVMMNMHAVKGRASARNL